MYRSKAKQDWTVGNEVKVGFLTLVVKSLDDNTNCYGQRVYNLENKDGSKKYTFSPYYGLDRVA